MYTPLPCHEQITSDFLFNFTSMMSPIPIDDSLIKLDGFGNSSFPSDRIHAIPDFQAVLQRFSSESNNYSPTALWVGECAFTQHNKVATKKLENFVVGNSDIELAFLISINEQSPFHRPLPSSPAAKKLRSLELKKITAFLPPRSKEKAFGPVVVEGHTWIHVTEITWEVWIKGGSRSIDFKNTSADFFAKGVSVFI